jgi:RND family efflux transporter MFP subunit
MRLPNRMGTLGVVRRSALAAAALGAAACSADRAEGMPPPAAPASSSAPKVVSVARPEALDPGDVFDSSLYVERDVRVTARTSGVIEQVLVDRGSAVKAGQPLAVLETEIAARELEMAEQELRLAEAEHGRLLSLHRQNVVSSHDFLKAEIARDAAASRVALERARLERCTVRAPFEGLVVERWAVAGQRVEEEDGTPLLRLVAREPLRARVDVPESRLPGLRPGARAWIAPPGAAEAPRPARVVFVGPAIDPGSGTVPVIVEADAGSAGLTLGASVRVRLEGLVSAGPALVGVPREALPPGTLRAGAEATLLVVEEGRAAARLVKVVGFRGASVMVAGDVSAEDRVILGGGGVARGDPVSAREARP